VKPWVLVPDFGAASGEVYAAVLEAFREQGIATTPVSRREVRFVSNQA
jgi:hypothetical protein